MKQSIVPRQSHLFIFVIFAIRSVPITAVRGPSLEKLILGLSDMLFTTQHTSRYVNTIVCAYQVLVPVLLIICETRGTIDLLCFQ